MERRNCLLCWKGTMLRYLIVLSKLELHDSTTVSPYIGVERVHFPYDGLRQSKFFEPIWLLLSVQQFKTNFCWDNQRPGVCARADNSRRWEQSRQISSRFPQWDSTARSYSRVGFSSLLIRSETNPKMSTLICWKCLKKIQRFSPLLAMNLIRMKLIDIENALRDTLQGNTTQIQIILVTDSDRVLNRDLYSDSNHYWNYELIRPYIFCWFFLYCLQRLTFQVSHE